MLQAIVDTKVTQLAIAAFDATLMVIMGVDKKLAITK
jgi:hypothetical protein